MPAISRLLPFAAVLLLISTAACQRDEVAHFRVPKTKEPPTMPAAMTGATGVGGAAGGEVAASLPPGPVLKWTLPKGWTETLGGGMRYATLKPATSGRIEITVVALPGPAGGELANVNRWRSQIGLPPVEDAEMASARKRIATKAGPVSVYDFETGGQARTRLVAAVATGQGNSWFVKMVGDAGPVASARPEFIRLLESLRFEAQP